MPVRGFFVSDLHLFASRSNATAHDQSLRAAAQQANVFVLGGDIFDFRWTTLGSVDATVEAAADWLSDLAGASPSCEFHYVLGNHDFSAAFITRLEQLQHNIHNLSWHRYFLRLGECVFLHGDVADGHVTHERLMRSRATWKNEKRQRGPRASKAYRAAINARLHVPLLAAIYPRQRVIKRIACYLDDIQHNTDHGVRRVFYGHTHRATRGKQHAGLSFFNGGAPMPGLAFDLVPFELAHSASEDP